MQAITRGAVAVCAIFMTSCAFSPPSFRVVPSGEYATPGRELKAFEILAPGVRRIEKEKQLVYVVDIPLKASPWRCSTIEAKGGGINARILWAGVNTAVLRVMTADRSKLADPRKVWDEWKKSDDGKLVSECLTAEDLKSIPERLVAARPVDGEESLEAVFGLSDKVPVVLLKPGMTVCASDAFMRNITASAFIPTGQLCARVANSPPGGYVLDPMRYLLKNVTAGTTDSGSSKVHKIASWAEVPRETKARQYLVKYSRSLPTKPSEDIKPQDVFLLISLGSDIEPDVRRAAMECIADTDTDKLVDFCQVPVKEIAAKCDENNADSPLLKLTVKPQCYRFGERGVMNVSMPVLVNGGQNDVDVGTLIGDAAARLGRAGATPPATMMRWHGGSLHTVEFELKDDLQALNLPLLPGDQLSW